MKDLTRGNIYKTFFLFSFPIVLAGLLSQGYATVNTILAGKLLGEGALAATGAIAPLQTFIDSAFWGYAGGLGIYTAQLFGAGDYKKLKSVVMNNFKFIMGVIVVAATLMFIFRYQIYAFLNVDPTIIDDCNRYNIVSFIGKPIVMFPVISVYIVHSLGDSSFPFYMSLTSTILNIALSVIAVAALGMGVEGLAFANVLSAIVVTVLYALKFSSCFKRLGVSNHSTPFGFKVIKETSRLSVPVMLQQSVMYFAGLFLSPMVNSLGTAATASYTITLRIYDINASFYINASKTVGNYIAQCYGAKKYHLLKRGLVVGFVQALVYIAPLLLSCVLFPNAIASIFYTSDASVESVCYTITFLRYCLPFLVINVVANLFHNYFRGVSQMKAVFFTTFAGSISRIVVSALLIGPFGIYGYYAGWVASWIFDAVACLIFYFLK